MTPMTHDYKIALMKAYKEGKTIEANYGEGWVVEKEPLFEFTCDYRIKPEPRYRPFRSSEEVMKEIKRKGFDGEWICWGGNCYKIFSVLKDCKIEFGNYRSDCETLFDEHYTFADGTPFGILEKE